MNLLRTAQRRQDQRTCRSQRTGHQCATPQPSMSANCSIGSSMAMNFRCLNRIARERRHHGAQPRPRLAGRCVESEFLQRKRQKSSAWCAWSRYAQDRRRRAFSVRYPVHSALVRECASRCTSAARGVYELTSGAAGTQHVYHFECIQSWFVQELNTNSMATCPQCKATVFDVRHLRASFDVPPTTAERSPIDVLLHVGEEFTECHRRGGRVLMGFMCLLLAFGVGCCFWVGISQATGAAQ